MYEPFVLSVSDVERALLSQEYRRFMEETVFKPSLEMVLGRHRRRPDYPYIDTKFNPNTGTDMPEAKYEIVYTWILGRGSEALQAHMPLLPRLYGSEAEKVSLVLTETLTAMRGAIRKIAERNGGICPHVVDRSFSAVAEDGNSCDASLATFGDIFCAKGMISSPDDEDAGFGYSMLREVVDAVKGGRHEGILPDRRSQGFAMITIGGLLGLARRRLSEESVRFAVDNASRLISHILQRHYDGSQRKFFEFVSNDEKPLPLIDPGHAAEFVAFSLGILREVERLGWELDDTFRRNICEAAGCILDFAFDRGWNRTHEGVCKLVNTDTGEAVNDDMPWWNLPEMMRAAALALRYVPEKKPRWLEMIALCNNAYFRHYPAVENFLFPVQTRSGKTGEVIDVPPALPEGDPLYHANLTFLEMLDVL